jgi:hypothetical protein
MNLFEQNNLISKLKKHLLIGILLCYIISTTKPLNPNSSSYINNTSDECENDIELLYDLENPY